MTASAHVSLRVQDLDRSIAFYRAFLGVEPALARADYAKFELSDPALVLSLEPVFHRSAEAFDHLGIRVAAVRDVDAMRARVLEAGLAAGEREHDVACCYSTQTKFWLLDPDRNLWEVYALTGLLDRRGALTSSDALAARQRAGGADVLDHRLGDALPERWDAADDSVDEVRLRGTLNAARDEAVFRRVLADAVRVVRPGGAVLVHALVSDVEVTSLPRLPGPAALVESTPRETEPIAWMRDAGLVDVVVLKLPESPAFCVGRAQMRELLVIGRKSAAAVEHGAIAVYRGPFASVRDDLGMEYARGARVVIDARTHARIRTGPLAEQFSLLPIGEKG